MIAQKFLQWSKTAPAGDRARAARLLARSYLVADMPQMDRRAAESAMVFLLDDPSPKVRLALAETLAADSWAPRNVILGLARDQIEIAGQVVSVSPVLTDGDLVDIVADGRPGIQRAVALRRELSTGVSAAIAEVGHGDAVGDLLDNPDARIAAVSLRRIAERFGAVGTIRARLLERAELPCDVRHGLIVRVCEALSQAALVTGVIGADRVHRVIEEASRSATLQLAGTLPLDELPALVEHLRLSGRLTPSFLLHALCTGNVDLFAAAVVGLSGKDARRVRAILVDGHRHTIRALYRSAGIAAGMIDIFIDATLMWREATDQVAGLPARSIPERLIARYAGRAQTDSTLSDLLLLVGKMDFEARRREARAFADAAMREAA